MPLEIALRVNGEARSVTADEAQLSTPSPQGERDTPHSPSSFSALPPQMAALAASSRAACITWPTGSLSAMS